MSETKRISIIDQNGENTLASVVQSVDDPAINGIVLLNPDGSKISGGGGGGHIIQDNGSSMTQRAKLNFIGATVADDAVNNATKVTITGGGTPGGNDSEVQYNNGGAFGGDPAFTFNDITKTLGADNIQMDTTPTTGAVSTGQMAWNNTDETLDIRLNSQVNMQLGQEEYIRVVNKTGVQINDGAVVRVSGAQGNRPTAVLAQANTFSSSVVIGVATQNIAINGEGFVTTHGVVNGFDTSNFSGAGAYLYLSSTTPGTLVDQITTPVPEMVTPVAVALNKTNNGSIFVSPFYPRSTDGTLAGNSNSYSPSEKAIKTYADTKIPYTLAADTLLATGVQDKTKSTITFDNTTKIFTIAPTSGTFDIYLSGVKYAKGTCTVDLNTIGLVTDQNYHIYFDSTGTLQANTTGWTIESNAAPVAVVWWNGTEGRIQEERHNTVRNLAWHQWAHDTFGTRYESGLAGTFSTGSFSIAEGYTHDEDISHHITTQTTALICYRNVGATKMTFDTTPSSIDAKIVGGALKYDNGGTLTDVSSGYYMRTWVYASNDTATPIYVVVGQQQYSSLADARVPASLSFPTPPSDDMRLLYRNIRQNVGGTPTHIESADYRNSPQTPGGSLSTTPTFLNDLEDVSVPSPTVDDVLAWNGAQWISKTGSTVSGGAGTEFFLSTPLLNTRTSPTGLSQDGTAGNGIQKGTLTTVPTVTAEQTQAGINNGDTRPFANWIYNTALSRTTLDAGTWNFTTYASVSSTANTPQLIRAVYQVVPGVGTLAFSGVGANSRTATISGGTPFTGTYFNANATNTVASWIEATSGTDKGVYQITASGSTSTATCTVRTGYANETGVTYNVWNLLFTASIPLTSTAVTKYDTDSTQGAFTVATTDKLGSMLFVTSTANARTVTVYYNGTARNTHLTAPLKVLHNQLSGLQGGSSTERYHITAAQATVVGNTSNTNTGDQTITNSSDATSHTVTLSASGGSVQLIEGANITLTTGGSSSAGTVTIAATASGGSYNPVVAQIFM